LIEGTETPPDESAPGGPEATPPAAPIPAHSASTYEADASAMMDAVHGQADEAAPTDAGDPEPKPKPKNNDSLLKQFFTTGIFGGIGHLAAHPFQTIGDAARGVMSAGIEGARSVATLAGAPVAGMDASKASANKIVQPFVNIRDALFGPKSSNSADSFVDGTAQFVAGMFGANEIKLGSFAVKALPTLVRGGVSAGIASGLAFDPHEAQWSEWASSSNIPVVQQLGQITTPTPQDGEIAARARRAMGGLIPGIAIDGMLATWGLLRANKVLNSTTATAAEKTVASAEAQGHAEVIKAVENDTHVPNDPAIVQPSPDGQGWQIVPHPDVLKTANAAADGALPKAVLDDNGVVHADPTMQGGSTITPPTIPSKMTVPDVFNHADISAADKKTILGPDVFEKFQKVADGNLPPAGVLSVDQFKDQQPVVSEEMARKYPDLTDEKLPQGLSHAEIMADAQRTKGAPFDNFDVSKRGWIDAEGKFIGAKDVGDALSPPTYPERYQAEAQAATINDALATRFQAAQPITDTQLNEVRGLATQIEDAGGDPDKLAKLYDSNNNFNFTYMDTPEKTLSVMKAMGEVLSPAFEKARAAGGISWDETFERTRQMAGMIPREDLQDFIRTNANVIKNSDAFVHLLDAQMRDYTDQAGKAAAVLEQRPLDAVAQQEARASVQRLFDMAAETAGTNSGLGRGLNALKARGAVEDLKFAGEDGAKSPLPASAPQAGSPGAVAQMSPEELRDFMQLFRLSDNPQVLLDTATKVLKPYGKAGTLVGGFFQVFYNTMLSNPATWGAIYSGVGAVSLYEDGIRAIAGIATRNPALVQEAADIMASRAIYTKQSIEGMAAALKAGKSVIDPQPIRHAIPTMTDVGITSLKDAAANPAKAASAIPGEFINTLGSRPIATMEEFWRVNNTLAKTRADALALVRRDAKAQNLTGSALDDYVKERVAAIVKASIDPETGASRLPQSRQFARYRSLMSPLEEGSFGKKLEEMAQDHPLVRAVMPFVRVTVNSADMAFLKNSPLGLFSKQYAETMNRGGPEAAVMQTRLAVGTMLWGAAGLMAYQGLCTGGGPANAKMRQVWLDAGNQPYSCKIAGKQISYRRLEPFSTLLSLTADVAGILRDHSDDPAIQEGGSKVVYAILAATADAFANKTYLTSLTKFMDAATSGEGSRMKAFVDQYIQAGVPGEIAAFNQDPYVRQTQGMFDAFVNKVPGWSKTLPAIYNAFGEPRLSTPGRTEKAINPYPIKDSPGEYASAESEQLDLGKVLAVPQTVEKEGQMTVNLNDRKYQARDKSDDTPYERWMGYIQDADLRGKVNKLIDSPEYERAGTGTAALVGGRRYDLLNTLVDRVQKQAKLKMLNDFPELKNDLTALHRAARVSKYSDDRGQSILDRIPR
jgi:hypothetical protein